MSRQLILMRHAKSAWDSLASSDYERTLTERGLLDAARMGQWLKENGFIPDYVLSSPALRAWQTTESVSHALGLESHQVLYDKSVYLAGRDSLLKMLDKIPADKKTVLLVGHNPGLDQLLIYLAANKLNFTDTGKLLTTASAAILSMPQDWNNLSVHAANLLQLMRPKQL